MLWCRSGPLGVTPLRTDSVGRRVAIVAAITAVVVGAVWLFGRSAAPAEPAPRIVSSPPADTVAAVADPNAVGLCALNRVTGVLEGEIIGIVPGADGARYHVAALDERRQAFHVRPAAVVLDHCARAIRADPSTAPLRMEEGTR
ncbi:hypothetical protein BH23GEM3_BH23GEM3_26860 [soil metagenome]